MVKKLLLFVLYGLTSFSPASAEQLQSGKNGLGGGASIVGDTTLSRDSLNKSLTLNDPKKDFKDLFTGTTLSSGVNVVQLNPNAVTFVEDYIEKHTENLTKMKEWGRGYFNMMDLILQQHGLPRELKYLSVIESNLKSTATSWAGAVGPWQFMPATGKRMGLKITRKVDERQDYVKSTHAAARYLTELYGIYQDWLLVIAAYNGGPGNVNSAIRKSGSRDFWSLQRFLPAESRNHVKKFIATHYIMEGQGGLTTLTKEETAGYLFPTATAITAVVTTANVEEANTKTLTIGGKYNSMVIVKYITMDITEFNRLNPQFDSKIATAGSYDLKLSPDKMDLFLANKFHILNESMQVLLNAANR